MVWNDWATASLDLQRFEKGSIEFKDYYGDVVTEAGIENFILFFILILLFFAREAHSVCMSTQL